MNLRNALTITGHIWAACAVGWFVVALAIHNAGQNGSLPAVMGIACGALACSFFSRADS